ncbi:MAG: hypothetical protein JXR70_09820 [Spirochaetales bacterium]|nr:hypothetical protein [Spirochaetales bacterium]
MKNLKIFQTPLMTLLKQEEELLKSQEAKSLAQGGIKDLDQLFSIINLKWEVAYQALVEAEEDPKIKIKRRNLAQNRAIEALGLMEDFAQLNISLDQKKELGQDPALKQAFLWMDKVLELGGGDLLSGGYWDPRKTDKLTGTLKKAVLKFAGPDDGYYPLIWPRKLPKLLKKLVNFFLPLFAPDDPIAPPYGIPDEEEEIILSVEKIMLPRQQAIHYYEQEILPQYREELKQDPGNEELIKKIDYIEKKTEILKELILMPRAFPMVLEKGFYTQNFTSYTADGEPLIAVRLPVSFKSKSNTDRLAEQIKAEVVRQLAGKGYSKALDKEYKRLKSIESGPAGDSRKASYKLNAPFYFNFLKHQNPALRILDNKQELKQLIDLARTDKRGLSLAIEHLVENDLLQLGADTGNEGMKK